MPITCSSVTSFAGPTAGCSANAAWNGSDIASRSVSHPERAGNPPRGPTASPSTMARVDFAALFDLLSRSGFVAADEEAEELLAAAGGDDARLQAMVTRRLPGEPFAWITGTTVFCGVTVGVDPG